MVSKIIPFLACASAVLAHPQRHRQWHHYGTGRLSGIAVPTGATFPINGTSQTNGTDFGGAPVESPSATATIVKTIAVSPVPLESSTVDSGNEFSSISVPIAVASNTQVAPVAEETSTCLTSTITTTSVEFVTFTAEAAAEETVVSSKDTGLEQLAPETSISLEASSVTAGAFYNRPTYGSGNTYSYGGETASSAPAVVPTTFATAISSAPVASGSSGASAPAGSSSAAPVSSSVPSTGGGGTSSGGKKGLSYNTASLTDAFAGKGISWAYNWAASPDGTIVSGAEYVPMLWGLNSVSAWAGAAASAIASGSKHALSFNEPDLGAQSNIDPSTAAQSHIDNMNPLAGQVSIGSPAITNGAGTSPLMGIDWLNAWFKACGGQCKTDFVAFHWYDSASNFAYFKSHVQDVITAAAENGVSKVWLTEFGASGSDSDVANFIQQATAFLDSTAAVERYAYFMASDGILLSGNSLSSLGTAYAG